MAASHASIAWRRGAPEINQTRAISRWIITVQIKSCVIHLDRWIAIQGAQIKAFLNAYQAEQSGASICDLMATI